MPKLNANTMLLHLRDLNTHRFGICGGGAVLEPNPHRYQGMIEIIISQAVIQVVALYVFT